MAKDNNLTDFLTDVADAIREKKGTSEPINPQDFSAEIASIKAGGNGWTGHADAEGLRAIGWTEEDIAYYQQYGVNWNEEDDHLHLVSEENKAMYGVINADNIADFSKELIYLPKIDTSGKTSFAEWLLNCNALVAIPMIDTSSATSVLSMCEGCGSLRCFPPLDFSNVTNISRLFYNCGSLTYIPPLNTSKATNWSYFCRYAYALDTMPGLDTSAAANFNYTFSNCNSLSTVRLIDVSKGVSFNGTFAACYGARNIFLKGLNRSLSLSPMAALSKNSLLYIISNAKATSEIIITLSNYSYTKYSEDVDVIEALARHPNITLAK